MTINTSVQTAISMIRELDLRAVKAALIRDEGFDPARADRAIALYRDYLCLVAEFPDAQLAPPKAADLAWHCHILNTRKYIDDCRSIFGGYLHHDPEAWGTEAFHQSWGVTKALFGERFGIELPSDEQVETDPTPATAAEPTAADAAPATCVMRGMDASADLRPATCVLSEVAASDDLRPATCVMTEMAPSALAAEDLRPATCVLSAVAASDDLRPATCVMAKLDLAALRVEDLRPATCVMVRLQAA